MMNYLTEYRNQDGVPVNRSTGLISPGYLDTLEEKLHSKGHNSNRGNKLAVGDLILLTTAGAIALGIGGCMNPNLPDSKHSQEVINRIEKSQCNLSQKHKELLVDDYRAINLNDISPAFLKLSYSDKINWISTSEYKETLDHYSECGILDIKKDKLSDRDFLLIGYTVMDKQSSDRIFHSNN